MSLLVAIRRLARLRRFAAALTRHLSGVVPATFRANAREVYDGTTSEANASPVGQQLLADTCLLRPARPNRDTRSTRSKVLFRR